RQEFLESHNGAIILPVFQQIERRLVSGFVLAGVRGACPGRSGSGGACSGGRSAGGGTGSRCSAAARLEIFQSLIEVRIQVSLLFAPRFQGIAQLIDIIVHGAHVAAQGLELIRNVQQTLIGHHPLDTLETRIHLLQFDLHRIFVRRGRCATAQRPSKAGSAQDQLRTRLHGRKTTSTRRFFAHAASSSPSAAGLSAPKLTVETCDSATPCSIRALRTACARRSPKPMLYSRVPRSSVLPSSLSFNRGLPERVCAVA